MSDRPILAVDPGQSGGAVLYLDGAVLAWWAWTRLPRKGERVVRVRASSAKATEHRHLCLVGERIAFAARSVAGAPAPATADWLGAASLAAYHLVVEGLFVPRANGKVSVQGQLALAEACGELVGPLRYFAAGPESRPQAREWRPTSGISSRCPRKRAEAAAVDLAARTLDWTAAPLHARLTAAEVGAVSEAALMAVHESRSWEVAP